MYGFHPHPPAWRHTIAAHLLGGCMWFWLLYRARQDGPVVLVRIHNMLTRVCVTRGTTATTTMPTKCTRSGALRFSGTAQ